MNRIRPREEMNRLDALLDQLIPGNPALAIPAAGEVGVADDLAALADRNGTFSDVLRIILDSIPDAACDIRPEAVHELERARPEPFRALLTETYKAYYSRPEMRSKVGIGDHPPHPRGYDVAEETEEFLNDLTSPVRERGPAYRGGGGIGDGNHGA